MSEYVGAAVPARPARETLPASPAQRWHAPFTAPRKPMLVRAGGALLLADGAGSLRAVRADPPGTGLAGWPSVPLPRGAFRPSSGDPLFVAHGGALLRARAGLTLDAVGSTGADDATEVEAFGLDGDAAVLAAQGRVWRLDGGRTTWEARAAWTPVLADDRVIVGTDRESVVIVDARNGTLTARLPREGRHPFASSNGAVWLRGDDPALTAIALDGSPRAAVPLAAPFPRLLLGAGNQAIACSGSLAVERVDLAAARVAQAVRLDAREAWPLLLAADGRVLYRDTALGLRLLDLDAGAEPVTLAEGAMTLAAHVHDGLLYVLEQSLDDPRQAAVRCFGGS